ncbi:MAG TPA: LysR family transcriptional regulator [Devosiaceae bacterium]
MTDSPDWSLWRSFAAVIADGSLSAAARSLGLSQPTLGRHIEALEAALGVPLFERTLQGLKPTESALRLYEPVSSARHALAEAALLAAGAQGELGGSVRITASTVVSSYVLPALLAPLRIEFPTISLEIVPSDSAENILMREADIAIRMFRPTQLELITRKLGAIDIRCCAHQDYLARRGTPQQTSDLYDHDLIGMDRSDLLIQGARHAGFDLSRDNFALRTDSQTLMWELIKAGLGVGFAQEPLIRATPGMTLLLPEIDIQPLEVWLTTHRELFTNRRIRAIYDRLATALLGYIG